jgi:hypothetical protein
MDSGLGAPADDIEALKAALIVARAEVASARAQRSDDQALIARRKLTNTDYATNSPCWQCDKHGSRLRAV